MFQNSQRRARIACLISYALLTCTLAASANTHATLSEFSTQLQSVEANVNFNSEDARLMQFLDVLYNYNMTEFPELATQEGYPGQNHRWTDWSQAAVERREEETRKLFAIVQKIKRDALSTAAKLDYDLAHKVLGWDVESLQFPEELLPVNQMGGVQQDIAQNMNIMPAAKRSDYDDIMARLRAAPKTIDQAIALMRRGLAQGITPPQITLRDVPQQVRNQLFEDPLQSPLLAAFKKFPASVDEREQKKLRDSAVKAYRKQIVPAFERLLAFLQEDYLPSARTTIGAKDLPQGDAWYRFRAMRSTTTSLTPQQIHHIGLDEVKRIRAEMDRVIKDSGFKGSFAEFTEFLRTDSQFFFTNKEQLLVAYRDIAKRADAELPKLFSILPRLPYGVKPIPAYAEKSQTTAYYMPGSIEAARPGIFYANTYDLKSRPIWEMEALTVHEAMPGHHLQIALAQEQADLHLWRRQLLFFTAFVEGWGLYSESLGEDMGFYSDPYSKFGQLTYEMWRAIRLVVDTGMHSMGWSRSRAIDFFQANSAKAQHDIEVEIDRYIVWPGQALAYKMGELKLQELRSNAQQALGEKFDIRIFHDRVLEAGPIPLDILERRIKQWVDSAQ
ncbi:MAG: DUF885 domain-containing protein [Pseudomonadales bacterium]